MDDWQAVTELLKIQYRALKPLEHEIRSEEQSEAKRRAEVRIAEVRQTLADEFKRHREAGMPQYVIQDVIGTKDWGALQKWRKLMNIASPKEIRAAHAAANSPFRWADDYSTLTVVKNSVGAEIEPVVYDMSTNRFIANGAIWWPDSGSAEENGISEAERAAKKDDRKFGAFVSDEIQRKIDNKEIEEP